MIVRAFLAVISFLALTTGAQAQNLVTNSGFEQGFTGWTSQSWNASNSPTSAPRSGTVQAWSNCGGGGGATCTLSQTIAITPGKYTFSVYAINPSTNPATFDGNFVATVGGQTLYSGQFMQSTGTNTNNTDYRLLSGTFSLNSNSTTIFFSGGNNQSDLAIDDVSLVRVGNLPEPATWGLMMLGFGMIGTALRRRRAMSTAGPALLPRA